MKLKYLFLSIMAFVSCTNDLEREEHDNQYENIKSITVTCKDFIPSSETRTNVSITPEGTAKFTWAENDTIGIFPNKGHQVDFPVAKGAGSNIAVFDGGGWALKPSSTYTAYYPYNFFNRGQSKIDINYEGQVQEGNASTAHIGKHDYMAAMAKTPENGNVRFDFEHLGCLVEMNLNLPDKGLLDSMIFVSDENIFINKVCYDLSTKKIISQSNSNKFKIACKNVNTSKDNESVKLYFMLAPTNASNKVVSVKFSNNGVNYEGSTTLKNFEAGKTYSLSLNIKGQSNVFHVKTPGTLWREMRGVNRYTIKNLKVTGEINSKDIVVIRDAAGRAINYEHGVDAGDTPGKLEYLDLSEARLVYGGGYYWEQYYMGDESDELFCVYNDVISEQMFAYCKHLKNVLLPQNIIEIQSDAFLGCRNLESIKIPNSVNRLSGAFDDCVNLTSVVLPVNIKFIDGFSNCRSLKSIQLPQKLEFISSDAFSGCTSLTSINIPDGVTKINGMAFSYCENLEYVKMPKSLQEIGSEAFSNDRKLSSLVIPEQVTKIGWNAFSNCSVLNDILVMPSTPPTILKMNCYDNPQRTAELGLPHSCNIYVPAYAVGQYKYTEGWDAYSSNIKPK